MQKEEDKMLRIEEKEKHEKQAKTVEDENIEKLSESASDMEIAEDFGTSNCAFPRSFTVYFSCVLERKCGVNCYVGTMQQESTHMAHEKQAKAVEDGNIKKLSESASDMEIAEDFGTSNCGFPRSFTVYFSCVLERKCGVNCYVGTMQQESTHMAPKIPKSFVETSSHQIINLAALVSLCRKHMCLLSVEHCITHPTDMSKELLITEVVSSVEHFFYLEYGKFKSSNQDSSKWLDHISKVYWKIFRDVSRALIFLHEETQSVCGDLVFNTFVTANGRVRILPTLDKSKKGEEDATQLIQLMKSVVNIPFEEDSTSTIVLPTDLNSMFNTIPRMKNVESYILVDHPFFRTVKEKIDSVSKFREFIEKDKGIEHSFQVQMVEMGVFRKWWDRLEGVYYEIWNTAACRINGTVSYKREVDISLFFYVVYNNVNDPMYKRYRHRQGKKFTNEEIESDLMTYFPAYHVTIFECLCTLVNNKTLSAKDVKEGLSIYCRDE